MAFVKPDVLSFLVYRNRAETRLVNAQNHCDGMCCAWFIEEGELALRVERQEWKLGPGHWIFLAPFQRRDQHFEERTIICSVRFQFPDPRNWRGFHPVRVEGSDWSQGQEFRKMANGLIESVEAPEDWATWAGRQERHFGWMKSWLSLMEKGMESQVWQPGESQVGEMLQELGRELSLKVDYEALGRVSGWSRSQIDRQFRRILGMTPRQWREQQVWREVEHSLLSGDEPIKSLAYRHGFSDPAHFNHWCKMRSGMTPGRLREVHAER